MARRRPPRQRKTRTREHVLADLSVNHVERQVLLGGHSLETITHDYGYDAIVFVYNENGEAERGALYLQIKGTETGSWLEDGQHLAFRLERAHLQHWLAEPMPVILCVYEASSDLTYWLYVQHYFEALPGFNLFQAGQTVTVRIPRSQTLTPDAVNHLATRLRRVLLQIGGRVRHD